MVTYGEHLTVAHPAEVERQVGVVLAVDLEKYIEPRKTRRDEPGVRTGVVEAVAENDPMATPGS